MCLQVFFQGKAEWKYSKTWRRPTVMIKRYCVVACKTWNITFTCNVTWKILEPNLLKLFQWIEIYAKKVIKRHNTPKRAMKICCNNPTKSPSWLMQINIWLWLNWICPNTLYLSTKLSTCNMFICVLVCMYHSATMTYFHSFKLGKFLTFSAYMYEIFLLSVMFM